MLLPIGHEVDTAHAFNLFDLLHKLNAEVDALLFGVFSPCQARDHCIGNMDTCHVVA